jgi:hypothetical protein
VLLGANFERYLGDDPPVETRLSAAALELLQHGFFRPVE